MDNQEILKKYFAYDTYREGEEQIIAQLLGGRDVLAILPNRKHKELPYQVAAMQMAGVSIVVSSNTQWIQTQINILNRVETIAVAITEDMSNADYFELLMNIRNGMYRMIYIIASKAMVSFFVEAVQSIDIAMVVIEDAHQCTIWGHQFLLAYQEINKFIEVFAKRPVVAAVSCVATKHVREEMTEILHLQNPFVSVTGFDRSNVHLEVIEPKQKLPVVVEQVERFKEARGVVYCSTPKAIAIVCEALKDHKATLCHEEQSEEENQRNLQYFLSGSKNVLVASPDYGSRLVGDIAYLIHYHMPNSVEKYYEDIRIVGNDGKEAHCVLLYTDRDMQVNKYYIESKEHLGLEETLKKQVIDQELEKLRLLAYYCRSKDCLREFLLTYFGEKANNYCGECSSCINNFELVDVTKEARKIVDCVTMIQEEFGTTMVLNILLGKTNEKLKSQKFHELPLFKSLAESNRDRLKDIMSYLIRNEYLVLTKEEYPRIKLGKNSVRLFEETDTIEMELVKPKASHMPRMSLISWTMKNKLFEELRTLRDHLAKQQGVEEDYIFSDATLHDMADKAPLNLADFFKVQGMGRNKVNRYGQQFIAVIEEELDRQS